MNDKLKPLREQIDDRRANSGSAEPARQSGAGSGPRGRNRRAGVPPEREAQVLRGVAERNPGPMGNASCKPSGAKSCPPAARWKSA
jgi:chorismate mutase/prephenate dehydratase